MREFWFTAEMIFIKPIWGALLYGPDINAAYTTDPLKRSWNRRTNLKGNRTSAFENAVDMHTEMKRKKGAKSAIEGAENGEWEIGGIIRCQWTVNTAFRSMKYVPFAWYGN